MTVLAGFTGGDALAASVTAEEFTNAATVVQRSVPFGPAPVTMITFPTSVTANDGEALVRLGVPDVIESCSKITPFPTAPKVFTSSQFPPAPDPDPPFVVTCERAMPMFDIYAVSSVTQTVPLVAEIALIAPLTMSVVYVPPVPSFAVPQAASAT